MTASFRLANVDGRFSPRNPLGPYYGIIDKNTPCRISVQSGNSKSYRFWGEVSSWPIDWDPTGSDAWVDVQASGILRRLGTGTAPLRSAPYVYWAYPAAGNHAIAYWPMEDASGATQFASAVTGASPMSIIGTPQLAGYTGIAASDALPSFTTGTGASGRIPAYTTDSFSDSSATCYVAIPTGGETGQVLITFGTTGSLSWELYYVNSGGGQLGVRGRDSSGNVQCDAGTAAQAVNGVPVIVGLDFQQVDPITVQVQINVLPIGSTNSQGSFISSSTFTMGRLTSVRVAPSAALTGTTIGHLAISTAGGMTPASDYQGTLGEFAAVRFQRLCNLLNVQSHIVFTSPNGDIGPRMGPQHSGAFLDLLQECVDVDGGIMFELTDRLGLGYRTRDNIENQTSAVLALDYSQAQLSQVPKPVDDDTYTRNDITVTRLNGSFTRAIQTSGPLNTGTPPAGVGTYATTITVNCQYDSQTADEAGWRLHLGTVPEPRYPNVALQLARAEITGSSVLRPNALAVQPGDRMDVANPPAWLPPDTINMLARGWTETFNQFLHSISWNTSPQSAYRVAVADDTTFGHADTDGSTLAAPALATDTTMSIATTNASSPTWTTNLADYPFDLSVGGERVSAAGPGTVLNADPLIRNGLTSYTLFHSTGGVDGTYQYVSNMPTMLVIPDGTDTQGGLNGHITGAGSVTAAATYTVGCWVYCPVGWTDVRACIDWYDVNGVFLSTGLGSTSTIAAGVWTFLTQDLTAVASASQCQPRFRWGSTPSTGVQFWVDTLAVIPDSTVSASSPQTISVVRSVNGVVKPQAQGTNVQLYQPATVAI
jgi:hypothetical protein